MSEDRILRTVEWMKEVFKKKSVRLRRRVEDAILGDLKKKMYRTEKKRQWTGNYGNAQLSCEPIWPVLKLHIYINKNEYIFKFSLILEIDNIFITLTPLLSELKAIETLYTQC